MRIFYLREGGQSKPIINKIVESKNEDTRIIQFNLLENSDEIPPHIHPHGEDCAYVLEGELTYYIDIEETITVRRGDLVVGWTNVIHGYKNASNSNVHFLVFATPKNNLTVYPEKNHSGIKRLPIHERIYDCQNENIEISSPFTCYKTIVINGTYTELDETEVFKSLLDLEEDILYIFEDEPVYITTHYPKRFLKFFEKKL